MQPVRVFNIAGLVDVKEVERVVYRRSKTPCGDGVNSMSVLIL